MTNYCIDCKYYEEYFESICVHPKISPLSVVTKQPIEITCEHARGLIPSSLAIPGKLCGLSGLFFEATSKE